MRKKIIPLVAIAIMVLLAACSSDDIVPEKKPEVKPTAVRTLSLTANTPPEGDDPDTRVSLTQDESSRNISLRWQVNDVLELAFVQGTNKGKSTYTLTANDIVNGGRTARFDIVLPDGISSESAFDLYGVYGGGGLSDTNPTNAILPTSAGSASSLAEVESRKDVMLYFTSKGVDLTDTNTKVAVTFKHLGSLFCITLKNTGSASLTNLAEAQLVGVGSSADFNWAYNSATSGQIFDLTDGENGAFKNTTSANNNITLKAASSTLSDTDGSNEMTFWAWYPPTQKNWPGLKLELRGTNSTVATSFNIKKARTSATAAGKSYYFYAVWDGEKLGFTDAEFSPSGEGNYTSKTIAELRALTETERNAITALKVTTPSGVLKKADFDIMKLNMPNLTYLDLKDATCENNTIPSQALGGYDNLNNKKISTIILPTSITKIDNLAFYKCTGLSGSLNLPSGLKTLVSHAFHDCPGLTGALVLPASLESIGEQAFANCTGFTSLTFGANIKTLGERAFQTCSNIAGIIVLPSSLTGMAGGVFCTCPKITYLRFTNAIPFTYFANMLCKNPWTSDKTPHPIQVPTGSIDVYKTNWSDAWTGITPLISEY